jgi:hypothetical protein
MDPDPFLSHLTCQVQLQAFKTRVQRLTTATEPQWHHYIEIRLFSLPLSASSLHYHAITIGLLIFLISAVSWNLRLTLLRTSTTGEDIPFLHRPKSRSPLTEESVIWKLLLIFFEISAQSTKLNWKW